MLSFLATRQIPHGQVPVCDHNHMAVVGTRRERGRVRDVQFRERLAAQKFPRFKFGRTSPSIDNDPKIRRSLEKTGTTTESQPVASRIIKAEFDGSRSDINQT
jgi:hypothetical protein